MIIMRPHSRYPNTPPDSEIGETWAYRMGSRETVAYLYKHEGRWRGENVFGAHKLDQGCDFQGAPVGNMGLPETGVEDMDEYSQDEIARELEAQLAIRFPDCLIVPWNPRSPLAVG